MTNEALAKVLCCNICVLIQPHVELGVNATSWGDEPAAPTMVAEPIEVDPAKMWAWV